MYRTEWKYTLMGVLVLAIMSILVFGSMGAEASVIDDIPDAVNDSVFDGENLFMAKLLIATAIMVSVGFAMAAARMDLTPIVIILFAVMGLLVALGWMEYWIMLIGVLVVVAMFGTKMADWLGSRGGI